METFSTLLAICAGNSPVPGESIMTLSNGNKHILRYWPFMWEISRPSVNSPHKGQWLGTLMFYLICAWSNSSVNNHDAGDLRHHRPHHYVTVMNGLRCITGFAIMFSRTWMWTIMRPLRSVRRATQRPFLLATMGLSWPARTRPPSWNVTPSSTSGWIGVITTWPSG